MATFKRQFTSFFFELYFDQDVKEQANFLFYSDMKSGG
jgi:hypothetical protein